MASLRKRAVYASHTGQKAQGIPIMFCFEISVGLFFIFLIFPSDLVKLMIFYCDFCMKSNLQTAYLLFQTPFDFIKSLSWLICIWYIPNRFPSKYRRWFSSIFSIKSRTLGGYRRSCMVTPTPTALPLFLLQLSPHLLFYSS